MTITPRATNNIIDKIYFMGQLCDLQRKTFNQINASNDTAIPAIIDKTIYLLGTSIITNPGAAFNFYDGFSLDYNTGFLEASKIHNLDYRNGFQLATSQGAPFGYAIYSGLGADELIATLSLLFVQI